MADIDDELLALAGGSESESEGEGDASDHEEERHSRGRARGRADSDDEEDDDRGGREASTSPPPASKKRAGGSSRKGKRKGGGDDSDAEEGEASAPGSPDSLNSAPMDESDSDAEVAPRNFASTQHYNADEDENKYPYEGLYRSRAEKIEIENMDELEREQLLADRAAETEKLRQNRILRQLVNQDGEDKKKKRNADAAELDDDDRVPGSARKASRPRTGSRTEGSKSTDTGSGSAMDSLRRAKQEKSDRQRRREEDRERMRDGRSPRRSRSPSNDRSPRKARAQSSSPPPDIKPKISPPAEVRDIERLRIGRHRFAEVCYTPGFADAVIGCYTRINVGPSPDTNVDQYRIGVIKEITTGRPYALEGPSGSFVTDQYVKAAHGSAAREFPFIACSDRPFTDAEWNRYKIACVNDNITIPNKDKLSAKISDIMGLINHHWTPQEIEDKIQRKKDFRRRFDPTERERLVKQIANAQEQGFANVVSKLQADLDNLSTSRLAFRTTLSNTKAKEESSKSQQDRLAEVNRENRRRNADEVRKAQLKEKARARDIEARIARGETVEGEDRSRRLRTKAKFVHDVNAPLPTVGSPEKKKADAALSAEPKTSEVLLKLQQERHKANGIPTVHRPLVDDDIIGALDLDIDIEI